jgi:dipeptidyl aminopeptidase/acylaminoacyl peptidase
MILFQREMIMRRYPFGLSCVAAVFASALLVRAGEVTRREVGQVMLENVPEIPTALSDRMQQYLNVRAASLLDFDDENQRILISTRFGNTNQLHIVDHPGGDRRQITFFDEPVSSAYFLPGSNGKKVVFSMDKGGSENNQIYLLNLDDGTSRIITDGKSKNDNLTISEDGKRIAFSSTARNGRDTDVYVADTTDWKPKRVWEVKGSFSPSAFSPLGTHLSVVETISEKVSHLHVLDAVSGKHEMITLDDGHAYEGGEFSANGQNLFFTSDKSGDFRVLYRRDLKTNQDTAITASLPWDIQGAAISLAGNLVAFVANEDGQSKLYTMEPGSSGYEQVKNLPMGVIGGMTFSKDGKKLGFSMQTPSSPSDLYVYSPDDGKVTQWTHSEIGGLNADKFVAPRRISYPTFDQVDGKLRMIPAYYYRPAGKGPFPVVINIHGGPEGQEQATFKGIAQYWATESKIAVIVPNVRGSTGYGRAYHMLDDGFNREDSVKDIGALLDWIAKQPELDAKRVAVYGGSYGGYMVLACLTNFPERIKAGIDVVGIANFITFLEKTSPYRQDLRRMEYGDERDPKMREFLTKISPLNNADKIKSALYVQHGANDPRVPAGEAEQIVKKLQANGQTVWYMLAKDEGHGFQKKQNRDLALLSGVMFLDEQLKGPASPKTH